MAENILEDILNNFLSVESLLEWLSNKSIFNEEDVFARKYDCSQAEFVSYFLNFLREQCSRDFQIYDAETPRKNSHLRVIRNSNVSAEKSSPQLKNQQNSSTDVTPFNLESLQTFPTLSSCSSKADSCDKMGSESKSIRESTNEENLEKRFRRVKLFSETVEGNSKTNDSSKREVEFLDNVELKFNNKNEFVLSTPKYSGDSSLPVVDYFNLSDIQAEISPKLGSKAKWRNQNLELSSPEINTPALKSRSFSGDSSHKSRDNKINCRVSLGDFILNDLNLNENKKEKKFKARKRINPVRVNSQSQISVNPFFNDKSNEATENRLNVSGVKQFEEILEKREADLEKGPQIIKNVSYSFADNQAELHLVSSTNELKVLSHIYSFLLNENYCQNIMIELCFIISLLVIQDYNKKILEADEILWLQRNVLLMLNLSALKLLSENVRIGKFNNNLKEFLASAYYQRQINEEIKRHHGLMKTTLQGNVSFQYETDNRENFTSDYSFHSFRKQRDLFYNILDIWEANHLTSGWIFSIGLGSKIRSLLSISSDPINLLHFSRLFRNQLIMSCCAENQTEEGFNEEILQLLPSADPNKILRLRARLTSTPKRQGPCPLPDFTGHQEFYKDFILCTSSGSFHQHLKNSFCDEILRLNDTDLTGDIEDVDSCLDEQTKERYLQCTNILKLLAKFLGFIEFLPYRGEKPFSDRILNIHCSVRHNTLPLFDVVNCLKSAFAKQKLTLTIPWMVSYLSMIDSYSAHLKVYQTVWRILVTIYKYLKTFKNEKNSFYLKLILGWTFQLPNFPGDQFYCILDEYVKNSGQTLDWSSGFEGKVGLDSYDFIEEKVLYNVCPYLNEINVILNENSACNVRHIRPVTTQENFVAKSQTSKQLELRLESNFLHNQSSSTRKTVEFVTERVASIAIKHLIYNIIPKIKDVWIKLENFSTSNLKEAELASEALSEKCYKDLLIVCEKENWEISWKRSEMALKALLSNDLQGPVADICCKIVTRQATEKVQRWMQSHVTLAMVKKEFLLSARKKFNGKKYSKAINEDSESSEVTLKTLVSKPENSDHLRSIVSHEEDAWPASKTLRDVRELICKICQGGSFERDVELIIEETIKMVKRRNDVIPSAEKALLFLTVDLMVCFCVHTKGDVGSEVFKKFFRFLKSLDQEIISQSSLERIVCPRNVALVLREAQNKDKAWENLGNFLMSLMEENFLTREQIESQLLSFLRSNWEKEDGNQFAFFISRILDRYSRNNGCDKFSLLLEYIIDTLNDEEPKSEGFG